MKVSRANASLDRCWQPSIDDLGTPLSQATFCVVDLETTGSGPEATITEFGAVKVRGGQVLGEFQSLVNPQTHIPALIAVLTGITDELVAASPSLAQVLPQWLSFAGDAILVAHNARFDIGFLKRACAQFDYPWPGNQVLDTVALARCALLRDEVANYKLATLAAHFHAATQPNHRAMCDARATVEVLHGLLERVGNLGVDSVEDLLEFGRQVSPQRRSKRVWAKDLPDQPGVYSFYSDISRPGDREILYVGKSTNLRRRVSNYFTASESRPRMEEMVRVATGVDAVVCATGLEAEIRELRMIQAHQPRYNRRSRNQDRLLWVKLSNERWPRLTMTRQLGAADVDFLGPFTSRAEAELATLALQEIFPIRQCTQRIGPRTQPTACVLADMGRCLAPCLGQDRFIASSWGDQELAACPIDASDGKISREDEAQARQLPLADEYGLVVAKLRIALSEDLRWTAVQLGRRMRELAAQERFEEAAVQRQRLAALSAAVLRRHRLTALARCPQIVAAEFTERGWEINVIRHGKLAAAALAERGRAPRAAQAEAMQLAETVLQPENAMPAGSVAEAERICAWLERPGIRLMDITGEWSWPINIGIDLTQLPALLRRQSGPDVDAQLKNVDASVDSQAISTQSVEPPVLPADAVREAITHDDASHYKLGKELNDRGLVRNFSGLAV